MALFSSTRSAVSSPDHATHPASLILSVVSGWGLATGTVVIVVGTELLFSVDDPVDCALVLVLSEGWAVGQLGVTDLLGAGEAVLVLAGGAVESLAFRDDKPGDSRACLNSSKPRRIALPKWWRFGSFNGGGESMVAKMAVGRIKVPGHPGVVPIRRSSAVSGCLNLQLLEMC